MVQTRDEAHLRKRRVQPRLLLASASSVTVVSIVTALLFALRGATSHSSTAIPPGVYIASTTGNAQRGPIYSNITALQPENGMTRWQYKTERLLYHVSGPPVAIGDTIYMSDDTNTTGNLQTHPPSGHLSALRASDGHLLWSSEIGAMASDPLIEGNTVYISAIRTDQQGNLQKWVYALATGDGSTRWKTEILGRFGEYDNLSFDDGRLFIGSNAFCMDSCSTAYLFALDAGDGQLAWITSIEAISLSPPQMAGDVLYITCFECLDARQVPQIMLLAYSTRDGSLLWRYLTRLPLYYLTGWDVGFLLAGGVVYAIMTPLPTLSTDATTPFFVVALDATTGAERWRVRTDPAPKFVAVRGESILVTSDNGLAALRAGDGTTRWRSALPCTTFTIAVGPDAVYCEFISGRLSQPATATPAPVIVASLAITTGNLRWNRVMAHVDLGAPASGGGAFVLNSDTVYVALPPGHALMALRASDGTIRWAVPINGVVTGIRATN